MLLKGQKDHSHSQEEFMTAVNHEQMWAVARKTLRETEQRSQHFTSPFKLSLAFMGEEGWKHTGEV